MRKSRAAFLCRGPRIGGRIARYREFIIFHGDRIYPEYVVAYCRN